MSNAGPRRNCRSIPYVARSVGNLWPKEDNIKTRLIKWKTNKQALLLPDWEGNSLTGLSRSKFGYRYPTDKSLSHTLHGAMLSQCYGLAFITNPATPKTGCPHTKYDIPAQTALNGHYSNLSETFTMQRNIWKVGWRQRSGQADGNRQTGFWQIMWPASIPPSPRTWSHSPSCAWEKNIFRFIRSSASGKYHIQ